MHINEMLNKKTYIGDIEPNPKEFGIWIKNDGSHMIYDYTNREWICNCSSGSKVLYYKVAAGTNIDAVSFCVAGAKIFDTSENRFEHVGSMMISIESMITLIAPNFSFATDEYYIAYLPIKISMPGLDGTSMPVVAPTLEDFIALMGLEMPAGITRITEEEYWDDSVPTLFYISNRNDNKVAFQYDEGMTIEDWINSDYNSIGLYYDNEYQAWNAVDPNFGSSDKEAFNCTMLIEYANGEIINDVLPTFTIQNGMTISLPIIG